MIGLWKWRRENGEVMRTGAFDDRVRTGIWKRYHPNGTLLDEGEYVGENEVGEWRSHDTKGKFTKTTTKKAK
jgi:antitoxin component YwqK of YwqJK toxin-antitoxin module